MGPSEHINPLVSQPALTEDEMKLRREFAKLFVRSHCSITACIQLGIAAPYAGDWARHLMQCCVTQEYIREEQAFYVTEESLKNRQNECVIKLRELGNKEGPGSSHGARVQAWNSVYKILTEMESAATGGGSNQFTGGVMMVPVFASKDDWGNIAAKAQEVLKERVRD